MGELMAMKDNPALLNLAELVMKQQDAEIKYLELISDLLNDISKLEGQLEEAQRELLIARGQYVETHEPLLAFSNS